MGRWSRDLAHHFVRWIGAASRVHWLDLGCGTGALTGAACEDSDPASVVGCDPSDTFIGYARSRVRDARASFVVAGAENFPPRTGGYGSAASLLALNFFPDPAGAVARMKSSGAQGGVVAACVWDYGDGMQYLRSFWDAARTVSAEAATLDEGVRFPICNRGRLEELFTSAGLTAVQCSGLTIRTRFRSFDDYWTPLLGGTGPAPAFLAGLATVGRNRLRSALAESLPVASDGSIDLDARAWAVRGYVP